MKSLKLSGLIFLLVGLAQGLQAQKSIRDSTISLFNIGFIYTGSGPGGDLADRFGYTNQVGMEATYKLRNNFYINGSFRATFLQGRIYAFIDMGLWPLNKREEWELWNYPGWSYEYPIFRWDRSDG